MVLLILAIMAIIAYGAAAKAPQDPGVVLLDIDEYYFRAEYVFAQPTTSLTFRVPSSTSHPNFPAVLVTADENYTAIDGLQVTATGLPPGYSWSGLVNGVESGLVGVLQVDTNTSTIVFTLTWSTPRSSIFIQLAS